MTRISSDIPLGLRPTDLANRFATGLRDGNGLRGKDASNMRKSIGEFVGGIFYGTLLKQMQESKFKTPYLRGGRGEDVFAGQLGIELAQRMGRSANNPVTDRLTHAVLRYLGKLETSDLGVGGDS